MVTYFYHSSNEGSEEYNCEWFGNVVAFVLKDEMYEKYAENQYEQYEKYR